MLGLGYLYTREEVYVLRLVEDAPGAPWHPQPVAGFTVPEEVHVGIHATRLYNQPSGWYLRVSVSVSVSVRCACGCE